MPSDTKSMDKKSDFVGRNGTTGGPGSRKNSFSGGLPTKGISSSKGKGYFSSGGNGLVSRLGFEFDVRNFDINAVSPTSW